VDPPEPKSKPAQFFFKVGFLNTVGENVNYPGWRVLIFEQGKQNSVGDPQGVSRTIETGSSEQSTRPWEINVVVSCISYRAEPVWVDENGKRTPFPKPDGTTAVLEFQVCP
jgi:hypothetical protein